jgi:hypothetical protein
MGHDVWDTIKDYWSTNKLHCTPFYSNQFMHVMKVLHFKNNQNPPDRANPDYDRVWKIRIFDYLNYIYCTLYHPTKNLALDAVIVKFKGRVVFRQYIPKKRKSFVMAMDTCMTWQLIDENNF